MKKRTVLTTILAIVCCISCMFFAACKQKVTVSFETEGNPIAAVQVTKGENYTLPMPGAREGYEFQGWYLTADFSGSPVTVVKADKNTTVYAKWQQFVTVELDPAGGTLPGGKSATVKTSVGKKVTELLQDYTPVKPGAQFYAWYFGSRIVNEDTVVPAGGLTLTAKYKYQYKIIVKVASDDDANVYVEDEDRSSEGYELEGKTISAPKFSGLTLKSGNGGTIKADGDNTFTFNYDRDVITMAFNSNYPGDKENSIERVTAVLDSKVTAPFTPECSGYMFLGWATEKDGAAEYRVYLSGDDIYNYNVEEFGDRPADDELVAKEVMLYAVWAKAYTNMFVSSDSVSDLIYLVEEKGQTVVYLYRSGKYFLGGYDGDTNEFWFYPSNESYSIGGRIVNETNYVYQSEQTGDKVYYYEYVLKKSFFSVSGTINTNARMEFDRYNGVTYTLNPGTADQKSSTGNYIINDSAYEVTFTDGDFAGQTIHFIRGAVEDSNGKTNYLFQIRDDEERGKIFYYSYVNGNDITIVSNKDLGYYIELDGYGGGVLHSGSQTQQITCFYDDDGNLDIYVNGSSGGKLAIIEKNGVKGFITYTAGLNHEFKNSEKTLTLDGAYKADYFDGEKWHEGAYTRVATSSLGGTIVRFYGASAMSKYFIVKTDSSSNTYSFEEVAENYSEMSYVRGTSIVSGRLFVINGETMVVYGVDKNRKYVELARGTYSEVNGEKIFVVDTALTAEEIEAKEIQPIEIEETNKYFFEYCTNFSTIERIVFKTNVVSSNGSTVTVAYWTSVEFKGESSDLNEATEYTDVDGGSAKLYVFGNRITTDSETGKEELTLGVFATFVDEEGNSFTGLLMKSTNFRYLAVSVNNNGTTSTRYFGFDVDTDAKTFLLYDYLPMSALAVDKNGQLTTREYLTLDGKGGAKHVTVTTNPDGKDEENTVEGTIETTGEKVSGVSVYRFTANDGSETFEAIIFTAGNYNAFAKKSNDFVGDYKGTFLGAERTLTLDGYILARFTTDGETSGSMYYFTTNVENQVMVILSSSSASYTYYFDLDLTEKTYTVRNSAYGNFLVIKNQSTTGMWFELDGYGTVEDYEAGVAHAVVKDYKRDEEGNFLLDEKGNYIEYTVSDVATYKFDTENGTNYFFIKYAEKNTDGSVKKWVMLKGLLTTVSISGNTYAAFVEVTTEIEEVYVNDDDWSVLILTSYGVARKIDGRTGTSTDGNYQLITLDKDTGKGMIYFATDSEAGIYKFDTESRKLTKVEFTYEKGYYTEELYSFYFSLEGYADYAKGTEKIRYYYDVDDAGNITLYYQDWYNSDCNEYGFVERTDFGKHSNDTKTWEGDTFYATGGSTVSFVRNADNAKKYALTSGGTKYYFGNVTFKPNGNDEFSISATIELLLENGEPYMVNDKAQTITASIKREILEREVIEGDETKTEKYTRNYLQIATTDGGKFTFDVDLKFAGSENSTYSINSEEWIMEGSSYRYNEGMMSLYLNYFQTGRMDQAQLAAVQALDYGSITFKRIYDENGDEIVDDRTIIAEFTDANNPLQNEDGSYWKFLDQQSSKPTTKGEGENRKDVTVIEAKGFEILNGAYKFRMQDKDGNDFMVALKFQSSQYFSGYGFYFDAISAYSEFEKEVDGTNYRVAVERIQWTENETETNTAGRIYWVSVGKVGEEFETVSSARYGFTEDGEIDYDSRWVIARTFGKVKVEKDGEKVEADGYVTSRLYKVKFSASGLGDYSAYDKAELTVEELKVAYSKDGSAFFEYAEDAEGKINIVTYGVYTMGGYTLSFMNSSKYVNANGVEYCEVTEYGKDVTNYVVINRNEDGTIASMAFTTEKPVASTETEQAA